MTSVERNRSGESGPTVADSSARAELPAEGWPSVAGWTPNGFPAPGDFAGPGAAVPPEHPMPSYPWPEPNRFTRFVTRVQARAPRWVAPAAALGCIAGAVGYTLVVDPTRGEPDAVPSCIVKLTTGLDCPGCGGTRAFWYVLHGDLPAAARHHLLFVFALPFLLYIYLAWAGRQAFGWRLPQLEITPKAIGIFLGAWGAFSVLRNLPWAPFDSFYV